MDRIDIKILGISATQIEDGNCDKLVQVALKAAKELENDETGKVDTEFISLSGKNIAMCKHCQWCIENIQSCNIMDDVHEVYKKMENCDGLILGSPTWVNTLSPTLQHLFSRGRYYAFFTNNFRNKIVGALTVGFFGFGTEHALDVIKHLVWAFNMISVAEASALCSTRALGQRPAYSKRGILDDSNGIRQVKIVGVRVAEMARMVKYATERGVVLPQDMQRTVTGGKVRPIEDRVFVEGVWREEKS